MSHRENNRDCPRNRAGAGQRWWPSAAVDIGQAPCTCEQDRKAERLQEQLSAIFKAKSDEEQVTLLEEILVLHDQLEESGYDRNAHLAAQLSRISQFLRPKMALDPAFFSRYRPVASVKTLCEAGGWESFHIRELEPSAIIGGIKTLNERGEAMMQIMADHRIVVEQIDAGYYNTELPFVPMPEFPTRRIEIQLRTVQVPCDLPWFDLVIFGRYEG